MDDTPPVVFQPEDGEGEWAIVIDQSWDAVLLRDLLRRAALQAADKAAKAIQRTARTRNIDQQRIFAKYAERCEHIRLETARQVAEKLSSSQP